ncbi:MAG: GTP cyclohydrolase II [Salinisphaera sp.]|jgi:GTP cyclohydrolase II|nr:GTP cyclohydrolase II [Salinisphaera sp.]
MQHIERSIFDLRRGLPVIVRSPEGDRLVAPIENLASELFASLPALTGRQPQLILTRHRLARLGIDVDDEQARLPLDATDSREDVIRWACSPAANLSAQRIQSDTGAGDRAAVHLMQRGLLIPAALTVAIGAEQSQALDQRVAEQEWLSVTADDIAAYGRDGARLKRVSEADVPLEHAEHSRFVIFREADGMREHVAILIGNAAQWPDPVPVRLHSACLTGDLFGSLRCDCGPQLRASVAAIARRGGGVLLYLAQEGRGIGLANKMRAYHLQDEGLDTIDADQVLGFGEDERNYNVALDMLGQLDITHIDLLTNNPSKLDALNQSGIEVARRSGIYGRLTPQNARYLNTKASRNGHWLDALLAEP